MKITEISILQIQSILQNSIRKNTNIKTLGFVMQTVNFHNSVFFL